MVTPLVRDRISQLVAKAIEQARQQGVVQLETTPQIVVERPSNQEHGDFATNLPLRLARATRINPLQLAEMLVERIPSST
jgi:arginyl-tRNA synthetase